MIALWLTAAACAAPPPPTPTALVVTGAVLEADGGPRIELAQATLDRDGRGQGTDARATTPGAPPPAITAPTSDWDLRAHVARFTGGVTAIRGDVTLTAQTLTVTFADADRVERAIAEGSVVVAQGARRATGARAELTTETGEVVITGEPVLTDGSSRMTGERVVVWLDDERVTCDVCRLLVAGEAVRPR